MKPNARWIAAALVGGLLLGASPAGAADWRWPWEKPKEKKEKVEPQKGKTTREPRARGTPAPFTGRAEDREMLPRLAKFYETQLDLADRAVASTDDPEVKQFTRQLQRQSEQALGTVHEMAREVGLPMRPHVRAALAERLEQSGRPGEAKKAETMTDEQVLQSLMENMQQIRADFAAYKEGADRETSQALGKLFDDQLVPNYDEAKALHDRVRNETRERNREGR